jgi:plasmid stability protein
MHAQPTRRRVTGGTLRPGRITRQLCCIVLAFCDMRTLYLRNVPDDVNDRLALLAAREGLSVSSFALRELSHAARRADNPALLGDLPDLGVSATDVVAEIQAGRSARWSSSMCPPPFWRC